MSFSKLVALLLITALLAGCGDNLVPSGDDRRPSVQSGTTGPAVGQNSADFSVSDINGATVTPASALAGRKGAVFYFTMWCPICDGHMNNMRSFVAPQFPDVNFMIVDYLSGSVADVAAAASASGFASGTIAVLADLDDRMEAAYKGTMGTTVVIDKSGVIRMNEDYKDGTRLQAVLSSLP